jgi:hypothetical protein
VRKALHANANAPSDALRKHLTLLSVYFSYTFSYAFLLLIFLSLSQVMFAITHSALELGLQEKHLAYVRKALHENAIALGDALRKHLPEYLSFRQPDGGYFVWIKCPVHWDSEALWAIARNNHKVLFGEGREWGREWGEGVGEGGGGGKITTPNHFSI